MPPAGWHIITSEYPPQLGGVSDYTHLVAHGLADAGDEVHVWCPATEVMPGGATDAADGNGDSAGEDAGETPAVPGVFVHREFGSFTSGDLRRVDKLLDQFSAPRRLLVQWVPHGYGYRSMNLAFCLWLRRRSVRHHDVVELMVHEPYLAFGEGSWKQNGVAAVHRLMTIVLMNAARRVWMSIPAWETRLRPYALGRALEFCWLPIASNIPVVDDPAGVESIRARYLPTGGQIVGHFGTYDRNITELLLKSVPSLLRDSVDCVLLLLGHGSKRMRDDLIRKHPRLTSRVHAAGSLAAAELSLHLGACDVLLQPYIDGVSSRRTSVMVGLAHGVPIVTTSGRLTEPLWAESEAVALAPAEDMTALVKTAVQLLADPSRRRRMSACARTLYDECFAVNRTIATLRAALMNEEDGGLNLASRCGSQL
jgi:glycosyltransferase involved in cell wall biosynthesis